MLTAEHLKLLPDTVMVLGNTSLIQGDLTLLLNSRQSKTPVGSDGWVTKTIAAVKSAIDNGEIIITSIGMNTWELGLWAIGEYGGKSVILCPVRSTGSPDEIIALISEDFELDPDQHAWVFVQNPGNSRSGKRWWESRDKLALQLATRIVPISTRTDGRFAKYLAEDPRSDQIVDERFCTEYTNNPNGKLKIKLPSNCSPFVNWNYLMHWTRRCYGPWPGERSADYYRAIVNSDNIYPRSATCTLKRILSEKRLKGSGNHIRNGKSVVAFTSLEPSIALPLMRWRKRYVMPTFEPYGIAIYYRTALRMGIRPVTYIKSGESGDSEIPELTQGYGTGDWPSEKEWRAIGDVDLSSIPEEDVIVLVPSEEEAYELRLLTRFNVLALDQSSEVI